MCEICKSLHELPCSTFLDIMNDIGIAYRQKAATFIYNQENDKYSRNRNWDSPDLK